MKIIEFIATILTIVSLYLVSKGNVDGFLIGCISNLAWLYYAEKKQLAGIAIVNAILIFINLNGLGVINV